MISVTVLLDCIAYGLAGERVLQFGSSDGKTIKAEKKIDGLLVLKAEMNLTSDDEAVGRIELCGFWIEAAGGGEVREVEGLPKEIQPVAEHVERASRIERESEFSEEGFGGTRTIVGGDGLPRFGLGGLNEVEDDVRMEGAGAVV